MERALEETITEKEAVAVVKKLIECAKAGEPWAIKELIDRCIGKPKESVEIKGNLTVTEFFRAISEPTLLTG